MVEVFKGTPIRRMTTGGNYVNLTADVVLLSDYEALRAELEQVKRERGEFRDIAARKSNQVAGLIKTEAAQRLAGARVKMPSGELCRYIEQCREISNGGEYPWWSRLAEILSALAEPAGEAEPVQVGWAYRDKRWDEDRWHVCGWEKPREAEGREVRPIFIGTTPPDASAIREALDIPECVLSLCADKITLSFESGEDARCAFDAIEAALAGAKP
ncbi:hypothetical protein [Aquamicrobium defluvii]|uniref:Uncharacterized protein n=1 Tax=Aquamicrobium defluvii TaxID=69279 RepID=A0A4R6Y6S8_9HYPH|nr:hypothetical protein [Aquamicrobium defluvii]TDR27813.1 hypothetical protein DES43_1643 [Aquamicrobium defluvii]